MYEKKYGSGDYRSKTPSFAGGSRPALYLDEAGRERAFKRADRYVRSRGSEKGMPQWMAGNLSVRSL